MPALLSGGEAKAFRINWLPGRQMICHKLNSEGEEGKN